MKPIPKVITLRECLDWMETGQPFSFTVVGYDRQRRAGGNIITVAEARIWTASPTPHGVRPKTKMEQLSFGSSRAPRHGQHYTRNIQVYQDGQPTGIIRKIHPPLLLTFNDREVVI